jgi:hypothetical protein
MAIVMVEVSSNGSYCDACEWEGEWPTTTSTGDHVLAYCELFQQLKALGVRCKACTEAECAPASPGKVHLGGVGQVHQSGYPG